MFLQANVYFIYVILHNNINTNNNNNNVTFIAPKSFETMLRKPNI